MKIVLELWRKHSPYIFLFFVLGFPLLMPIYPYVRFQTGLDRQRVDDASENSIRVFVLYVRHDNVEEKAILGTNNPPLTLYKIAEKGYDYSLLSDPLPMKGKPVRIKYNHFVEAGMLGAHKGECIYEGDSNGKHLFQATLVDYDHYLYRSWYLVDDDSMQFLYVSSYWPIEYIMKGAGYSFCIAIFAILYYAIISIVHCRLQKLRRCADQNRQGGRGESPPG